MGKRYQKADYCSTNALFENRLLEALELRL
jgi:hypothetical protein